jgi:energy-coupling factor transport system permease protein
MLHPGAWIAWLTSIGVFAFVVTNPLYVVLALAAVIVVHLSFPADPSPVGRAVRLFVVFGLVLLAVRVAFIGLLPNPGSTTLFSLPELGTPRFLGGLELGGPVSAEVLVAAASEGLRLVVVLAAFGVLNAHADLSGLLRTVPAAFRDVGLVASIAVAFVPGVLRTMRDVRDAQRLRGEWGLRRLAPTLVVPVLGMSLERALLLAESMDARGYGRGEAIRSSRMFSWAGLGLLLLGVATWVWGAPQIATVTAAAGGALLAWGFRTASVRAATSRLHLRAVTPLDVAVIVASAAALAAVMFARADALYDPYPVVSWPGFSVRTAAVTLLFALPALVGAGAHPPATRAAEAAGAARATGAAGASEAAR